MNKEKIAITLDKKDIEELDRLVNENVFQNRIPGDPGSSQ